MLQNIGLPEIIVILLVILIFFGPGVLTDLARQLGKAGKELKNINKEYKETVTEFSKDIDEEEKIRKPVKTRKRKKKGGDN